MVEESEIPYDSNDPEQIEAARKKSIQIEAENTEVMRRIMNERTGRQWMFGFLQKCHIHGSSFHENPHFHAFLSGEENVGKRMLAEIMRCTPEQYSKMCKEANS